MTAARIERAAKFTLQRTISSPRSPLAAERGRSPHGERPIVEDFGRRSDVFERARGIPLTVAVMAAVRALSAPLAADAQLTARPVKIGALCAGACPFGSGSFIGFRPFVDALARIGPVEGRSLVWDIGGVVASEDGIDVEASKLVSRRPDL